MKLTVFQPKATCIFLLELVHSLPLIRSLSLASSLLSVNYMDIWGKNIPYSE